MPFRTDEFGIARRDIVRRPIEANISRPAEEIAEVGLYPSTRQPESKLVQSAGSPQAGAVGASGRPASLLLLEASQVSSVLEKIEERAKGSTPPEHAFEVTVEWGGEAYRAQPFRLISRGCSVKAPIILDGPVAGQNETLAGIVAWIRQRAVNADT